MRRRRGLILVVVLVMIALLSLLAASYSFMVRSYTDEVNSQQASFYARMAAESGIQHAIVVLRAYRNDPTVWYDNPAVFRAVPVTPTPQQAVQSNEAVNNSYDPNAPPVWRFNLVAPNPYEPATVRYGVTDETSRLDLNLAKEDQLRRLFQYAIPQETTSQVDVNVLVDSLLDWREKGTAPRPNGAKDEYYAKLEPGYRVKGARFSTIEELLLVRGFSGWVLYGEDYNQNGLLDPNEDDGANSFPPDNGDGVLYPGVAPYLTIWSYEANLSRDGRPRINLNMKDTQKLQEALEAEIPPQLTSYIMAVRTGGKAFNSVMNLIPAPEPDQLPEEEAALPEDPATTQPQGDPPASQPGEENPASQPSESTDQGRSEKQAAGALPVFKDLTPEPPPGTYEDLPLILDRLTVDATPAMAGRINVSTAPLPVLASIVELTDEEVQAIFAARQQLDAEQLSTPAFLVTAGLVSPYKFRRILPKVTSSSAVFTVDAVGYGDHTGVTQRIKAVLEMRGPVAQVRYYRNMSSLGTAYLPHVVEQRALTGQGGR